MQRFRNKIAVLLVICICAVSFGACKKTETPKEGNKREKAQVTVTATPTAEPTVEPTVQPTETPTPVPTQIPGGRPWSVPNFTKVEHTGAQAEFDKLLDELVVELADGAGISLHFIFENGAGNRH